MDFHAPDRRRIMLLATLYPSALRYFAGLEWVNQRPHYWCIGPGWYALVDHVCDCFENAGVVIEAVGQSFGKLVIHIEDAPMHPQAVAFVRHVLPGISAGVCERCGATEGVELRQLGMVVSLCAACDAEVRGSA